MDFLDMIEKQSSVEPKPWMKRKTLKLVTSEGHVEAPPSGEVVDMTSGTEEAPTEWDQPAMAPGDSDPDPSKDNWAMIDEVVDACIASGLYGIDLETTGLDTRVFPTQDGHLETVAKIVGICLTPDGERGYYIPVRHVVDKGLGEIRESPFNAPMSKVRVAMERLTSSQSVAIFQNAKYDQELLQFNGGTPWGEWDTIKLWEDTLILAYLEDTRRKRKGLKFLSDTLLSMEMIELYELWGHDKNKANFDYNFASRPLDDPATIWYAAGDAICTYELFKYLHPKVVTGDNQSQTNIYSIEKAGMVGCRWMERCRVHTDRAKVAELIAITQQQYMDSTKEVYETASEVLGRDIAPLYYYKLLEELQKDNPTLEVCDPKPGQSPTMLLLDRIDECMNRMKKGVAGPGDSALIHEKAKRKGIDTGKVNEKGKPILLAATFDLKSQKQLGIMLDEMGVPLPRTEKSGQIATSAKAIDGALEAVGDRFPWIGVIKRFRNLEKGLSTYLYSLWRDAHPSDHTIRINFNGFKGDTGRYSVKGSKNPDRDGYSGFPFHGTPNTYDKSRPEGLRRIRECISARPGKMLAAIDFSGEELRIVTNLSGEPKWYNEFFRCSSCGLEFDRGDGKSTPEAPPPFCPKCGSDKIGDIHTLTALSVYGADAINRPDWKILRNNAKSVNFALCYGGGGQAVVRAVSCDENEGWRIKRTFDRDYGTLKQWWDIKAAQVKSFAYVTTGFGRHCAIPDINMPKRDPATGRDNRGFIAKALRNAVNAPVQGTGADIIKIATAMIYKHVKKRGWFGKVLMIGTIHDELVFEIDLDIVEQAINEISEIMTRNQLILRKNWLVPFTVDVEGGPDWTVPWNITEMQHGKKEWPDELKPYFKPQPGDGEGDGWDDPPVDPEGGAEPEPEGESTPEPETEDEAKAEATEETPENDPEEPPPTPESAVRDSQKVSPRAYNVTPGGIFIYTVKELTVEAMLHLAKAIVRTKGLGTQKLRLQDVQGNILNWTDDEVYVSEVQFKVLMENYEAYGN